MTGSIAYIDYAFRANEMLMYDSEHYLNNIVFSDESTCHLTGHVNTHYVRIWGSENPYMLVQVQRVSAKLKIFCAISRWKVSFLAKLLSLVLLSWYSTAMVFPSVGSKWIREPQYPAWWCTTSLVYAVCIWLNVTVPDHRIDRSHM